MLSENRKLQVALLSSQLGSLHLGSRDLSGSSQQLSTSVGVQQHTEGPENGGPPPMSLPEHRLRGHCCPSGSSPPAHREESQGDAGSITVPFISQKLSTMCKHQRHARETAHSAKWGQSQPHRAALKMKGNNACPASSPATLLIYY